jgi:UPF0288 family protein (methanogenesis marker protein 3)
VYFGGQTYTYLTYTKTYIAFSNLWILKININSNLFSKKLRGAAAAANFGVGEGQILRGGENLSTSAVKGY